MTEFCDIPTHPGYRITRDGRVKGVRGFEMKGGENGKGYRFFPIHSKGKPQINVYIHTAMLETFVGPRPSPQHQGRHLNGHNWDNRIENLAWGTVSENILDQVKHGTHPWGSRTECSHGHEFTPENTIHTKSGRDKKNRRVCRICRNRWQRESRRRCKERICA